ncbi:hypothetical protein N5K32_003059 [Vibrio parahaemolyticus]|uniref:hypothetical protein n=1 Tax=Vibrio parahaemolyticus TaxID=670 RepID=UPI0007A0063A|nr:hypothetical protein [Vibrio parahaemolyticus]EHZ7349439.1 hypothetical protein [Vibrio parahaemolyticus]EJG0381661.1 hypothetical protein [Vibrio parahaemolyticus]EJG0402536.1 hypothetical protein [Vibrio parahaemolyticus]EJG2011067.1 hypothetical protein [Vibrio parahaemolyticus]EJU8967265.1 hypothetical protein [Vibrio parahaemolyticus]
MMKFTEKEIQDYIWKNKHNFSTMLDEDPQLTGYTFKDDLSDISAEALIKNRIYRKIERLHSKLFGMELIGCEVPLEQSNNSTIRADFLAVFPGDTGIAVVELKKSSQTERQAFTELLAYSNHLTTVFPAMSREDSIYILIAPMTTRIARDAVIQTLTFDNRNIITLIPTLEDPQDISSLKLKLWVPSSSELAQFSNLAFRGENFSVCKIVWEHVDEWWNPETGENPTDEQIARYNSISTLAAQQMEEAGIHGFTYCSQQWPELNFPFPNSLILVGLNPYAVGSVQYALKTDSNHGPFNLPKIGEVLGASLSTDDNEFVMSDLYSVWCSQLFRIGKQVVELSTQTIDKTSGHLDQDFFDWESYQQQFLEDVSCHNFLVRPTGIFRHMYGDVTAIDYDVCRSVGLENHPLHGDMHYVSINALTSHYFFRQFLNRLFGYDE